MEHAGKIISTVLFIIVGFLYFRYDSNKVAKKRENFSINGGYAIGVFESRISTRVTLDQISFNYSVNSKKYYGIDSGWTDDSSPGTKSSLINSLHSGDWFLVIYDINDPGYAIIRMDRPIKDSSDFKRYVHEFEEMRKQKNK